MINKGRLTCLTIIVLIAWCCAQNTSPSINGTWIVAHVSPATHDTGKISRILDFSWEMLVERSTFEFDSDGSAMVSIPSSNVSGQGRYSIVGDKLFFISSTGDTAVASYSQVAQDSMIFRVTTPNGYDTYALRRLK